MASSMDGYKRLANGIVEQAVLDWRKANKNLSRIPKWKRRARKLKRAEEAEKLRKKIKVYVSKSDLFIDKNEDTLEECERFFLSDWFKQLTDISGEKLLKMLKESEK